MELVVVVVGILLALGIDSLWAGRQDRALEDAFLRQLRDDLSRSENQLSEELVPVRDAAQASLNLASAIRAERPTMADSIAEWLREVGYWSDPLPTTSTAQALASSPDFYLVRDSGLREAIVMLVDKLRQLDARLIPFEQRVFDLGSSLNRLSDPASRGVAMYVGILGGGGPSQLRDGDADLSFDVDGLLESRELYDLAIELFWVHENLRWLQQSMLDATIELRERVEADLPG